jgi:predicted transposase/invertase (TIGR01784 family)
VQYSRELDYLQRILYGSAKVITEHLEQGAAYAEVNKVISISILHFDWGKGDDYIYHGTTRFIGLHNQQELQLSTEQQNLYQAPKIADLYPEYYLIELKNFHNLARDTLDEWIYFLKNEEIKNEFSAKGLQEAKEVLDVLKMSSEERLAYEHHQEQLHYEASMYESTYILGKMVGKEEGREEGILIGEEQGFKKGQLLSAKNMKTMGIEIEIIAEVTGLSIAQIESL